MAMKKIIRFCIPFIAACLMLGMLLYLADTSSRAAAAPSNTEGAMLVTTLEDELNSDGDCSLREAITAANDNTAVDACPAGDAVITDTITFDVAGTITVSSQLSVTAGGPLEIDGGGVITTSGGETTRVWWVESDSELILQRLAVVNGQITDDGAGLYNNYGNVTIINSTFSENTSWTYGGGIYSDGSLIINDSTFSGNYADFGGGIWGITITITNSTFSGNFAETGGGISSHRSLIINDSIFSGNSAKNIGGAISGGNMTLTNNTFSGNIAGFQAGGIYSFGIMTITDSIFFRNTADYGGGIYSQDSLTITIVNSTFSDNSVDDMGGGIYCDCKTGGYMTITNSTFSGNSAGIAGGGIFNSGISTITNSTFSVNTADLNGGGIYNENYLYIINSTFSGNSANEGGGVAGSAVLTNTIIANSLSGGDCFGSITDGGYNLDSDGTCGLDPANGSLPNTNPMLGPLQDNGGPTWTRALLPDSPAIDAGDDAQCPPTDQRGVIRPIDGDHDGAAVCDIGSYEFDANYLIVTTLEDELNSDGDCSLREAITAANTNAPVDACPAGEVLTDTIGFNVSGTIIVTSQLSVIAGGPLVIDGGEVIITSGGGMTGVWWVYPDSEFVLQNMTTINGNNTGLYNYDGNVAIINNTFSNNQVEGAIVNDGTMSIERSTFSGNRAYDGGAITNYETLTITGSTFTGNNAEDGGAIDNEDGAITITNSTFYRNSVNDMGGVFFNWGSLTITGSRFTSNRAVYDAGFMANLGTAIIMNSTITGNTGFYGGAIFNDGEMTVTNSILSDNVGSYGGGIDNPGILTVTNSTFYGNVADIIGGGINNWVYGIVTITNSTFTANRSGSGGAIYNQTESSLTIVNSTISGNSASEGGGIYNDGSTSLSNTVIANSFSGGDCFGAIIDGGHNIDSDGTCSLDPANGSLPNTDPILGPLHDNGGPTWTHALLPGSPAIDAGDDAQCPATDQRGVTRPRDGDGDGSAVCDIGSFELEFYYLIVTTLEDELNNDGDCSLREAIEAANTNAPVDACPAGDGVLIDTITFDVQGIITVTSQLSVTTGGPLVIDGREVITTSGGGTTRVWWVETGSDLTISNLSVVKGFDLLNGAGLFNHNGDVTITNCTLSENNVISLDNTYGGAIYNVGNMTIISSTFSENTADYGGGVSSDGSLTVANSYFYDNNGNFNAGGINGEDMTITNSIFIGNTAGAYGGGIATEGHTTIIGSTFSFNSADWWGGGIFNAGALHITKSTFSQNNIISGGGGAIASLTEPLTITSSTFSGNTSENGDGGGIHGINLTISDSTFSGNYANHGGGILGITVTITNSTFSGNSASEGGGIYSNGSTSLSNTIIANSLSGGDCFGAIVDAGHNLDTDGTCGLDPANGSLPNTDPMLGPLQDNGGPTWTHALLPASPAIDAGANTSCPPTDQRGVLRPLDGDGDGVRICDIGAYEFHQYQLIVTTREDELNNDGDCSLREAVATANENLPVDDCGVGDAVFTDTITFDVAGIITVTSQLSATAGGPLLVDGGDVITTSGGGTTRVWWVEAGSDLTLQNINVADGYVNGDSGAGLNIHSARLTVVNSTFANNRIAQGTIGEGAGIANFDGTLVVINSTFLDNWSDPVHHYTYGGGISTEGGSVTVTSSTFTGNSAYYGGGIFNDNKSTLTVIDGTFSGNNGMIGSGICNQGTLSIALSTFSQNTGLHGAGIYNYGTMAISSSDFFTNTTGNNGGAIYNRGSSAIENSTISGNDAAEGGGIYSVNGFLTIANSSFINNHATLSGAGIDGGTMAITNTTFSTNSTTVRGAAIEISGRSTIFDCSFLDNHVTSWGGAIYSSAPLTITHSIFIGNETFFNYQGGGAIASLENPLTIIDSTFSGNRAENGGGGAIHGENLFISGSTFSDNYASLTGGAIYSTDALITNSTLSGNTAGNYAGGIFASGEVSINYSTISGNSASLNGGGIYNYYGSFMLTNTIIANSLSGGDCFGAIIDGGHNLSSDGTCGFDPGNGSLPNTDPLLGPLQDNGGPTRTHALLPGSPAIDAGDDAQCPPTDQRGVPRPLDGDGDGWAICDMGSYEVESPTVPPTLVTINGPSEGLVGQAYIFTATVEPVSTTLPLEYVWQTSGQAPVTHTSGLTDTLSFTWEMPGMQVITVTARNPGGSVMDTHGITITDVPISGLVASNDSPTLLGGATTLCTTVISGTNIIYAWDFGDGGTGTGAVVMHTYPYVGVYTAIVTATNAVSSIVDTTLVVITDVPIDGLSASNDSPTLLGSLTTMSATVTAGSNIIYAWDFGDGGTGSGAVVTHTYLAAGLYTATVTATNSANTLAADTRVTIVAPLFDLYLPLILKPPQAPLAPAPASSLPQGGVLVALVVFGLVGRRKSR
jgi:CSLREA domain-containing protein